MSVLTEPTEAAPTEAHSLNEAAQPLRERTQPRTAEPVPAAATAVTVDIYDQTYHLRGQDPAYIQQLAEVVDSKMRAVAAGGTTVDSLRVAVLAALNVADELMRTEAKYRALSGSITQTETSLRDRTANLSGLLDSVLEDRIAG